MNHYDYVQHKINNGQRLMPSRRRRSFDSRTKEVVLCNADWLCHHCGKRIEWASEAAIHHEKPLSLKGTNAISNLVPVHLGCHEDADLISQQKYGGC